MGKACRKWSKDMGVTYYTRQANGLSNPALSRRNSNQVSNMALQGHRKRAVPGLTRRDSRLGRTQGGQAKCGTL